MIKVYELNCGQVGVDPAVPDRSISRNTIAYTGLFRSAKRRIWLPVKAFFIVHPKGIFWSIPAGTVMSGSVPSRR